MNVRLMIKALIFSLIGACVWLCVTHQLWIVTPVFLIGSVRWLAYDVLARAPR